MHLIALEHPDVICLTEILPKSCRTPLTQLELQIDGYDCFDNLLEDTVHRGDAIYVNNRGARYNRYTGIPRCSGLAIRTAVHLSPHRYAR